MATEGAGVIVTADIAETVGSSYEMAVTFTVVGEGGTAGAVYNPLASISPTVPLPLAIPFTCQVTTLLVPPEIVPVNWYVDATFTEVVAGETVTEIPVVGSVHVDVDVAVEVVEVVVAQVTAVLAAVPPQEVKPKAAVTNADAKYKKRLTAPLSSVFEMTKL